LKRLKCTDALMVGFCTSFIARKGLDNWRLGLFCQASEWVDIFTIWMNGGWCLRERQKIRFKGYWTPKTAASERTIPIVKEAQEVLYPY